MKKSVFHAVAGAGALLIITTFWASTVISELFLGYDAVTAVKHAIVRYGLVVLIAFMASVGSSGFFIGKGRKGPIIDAKKRRMRIIALNGFFIMIPSALYLDLKASHAQFDMWFYAVQVLELLVGLVQIMLLSMSFKDGLRLTGKLRR